jgi:hypothetical protein
VAHLNCHCLLRGRIQVSEVQVQLVGSGRKHLENRRRNHGTQSVQMGQGRFGISGGRVGWEGWVVAAPAADGSLPIGKKPAAAEGGQCYPGEAQAMVVVLEGGVTAAEVVPLLCHASLLGQKGHGSDDTGACKPRHAALLYSSYEAEARSLRKPSGVSLLNCQNMVMRTMMVMMKQDAQAKRPGKGRRTAISAVDGRYPRILGMGTGKGEAVSARMLGSSSLWCRCYFMPHVVSP